MSWHALAANSKAGGQKTPPRSHHSILWSGSPGYLIRGCTSSSWDAAGSANGTSTTWITPWCGLLGLPGSSSYGLAVFRNSVSPQVGPGRSGYEDTYTSSLG